MFNGLSSEDFVTHREQRITSLMEKYGCDRECACDFINLREEGYSAYESAIKAGLRDPDHYEEGEED